jgi:hypothetical protein
VRRQINADGADGGSAILSVISEPTDQARDRLRLGSQSQSCSAKTPELQNSRIPKHQEQPAAQQQGRAQS